MFNSDATSGPSQVGASSQEIEDAKTDHQAGLRQKLRNASCFGANIFGALCADLNFHKQLPETNDYPRCFLEHILRYYTVFESKGQTGQDSSYSQF